MRKNIVLSLIMTVCVVVLSFACVKTDAVKEATSIGISANRAVSYNWTAQGTDALYSTVTAAACATKCASIYTLDLAATYTDCLDKNTNVDINIVFDAYKNNCQKCTIKVKSNSRLMFDLKSFRELLSRKF